MKGLDRKLIRDLLHLRGQVIAIVVVIACGAMSYVAMRATRQALLESQRHYYSEYRFADLFAQLKRAPESLGQQIGLIPGVSAFETRVVAEVTLDVPGLNEPATGRLISIPEKRRPMLNYLHLLAGRYLEPGKVDEAIISGAFSTANRLAPGDPISAIVNGKWRRLRIVGIALSPEYIYEIRPGDLFPDPRRFGVLWMSREAIGPIFDLDGAFNDLSLSLAPGANQTAVIQELDRLLERYGGFGAAGRDEHPSHRFISNELDELRVFGTYIPAIFLAVTAFLLHMVLSRLVYTQRDQIGVLKAFGYSNWTIGIHFLKLSLVAVVSGAALGLGLGFYWGRAMASLYAEFFRFPELLYRVDHRVMAWAVVISGGAAVLGALGAVRKAVSIPPAEAMRPEPPARFQAGIFERMGFQRALPLSLRIILRNLERTPIKAGLTTLGISLSIALLFIGFYFFDAVDHLVRVEFQQVLREDITLFFNEARPRAAKYELMRLPGVLEVETFRSVPVRLRNGHRSRRLAIQGMEPGATLRRVIDARQQVYPLPPDGLLLTAKLAEILDLKRGDAVTIEILEGNRRRTRAVVTDTVEDMIGLSAYMESESLHRLAADGGTVSGAHLLLDDREKDRLYKLFKQTPAIQGLLIPEAVLNNFNETMARTIGTSTTITILLACVIAFGLVYNGARIALSERGRELASLRVLGFTKREITVMLLGEQAILTLLAVPLGYLIGYGICALIIAVVDTELIRLPLVLSARTFFYSAGIIMLAAFCSAILIRHRLERLNLIEVLKTRE